MKTMKFPAITTSLSFVTGILVSYFVMPGWSYAFFVVFILTIFCAIIHWKLKQFPFLKKLFTAVFPLTAFFLGILTYQLHWGPNYSHHYTHLANSRPKTVEAVIIESLKSRNNLHNYYIKIKSVNEQPSFGKALLKVKSHTFSANPGDKLILYGIFDSIPKNKNPEQFNYRKYLHHKQIFLQLTVDSNQVYQTNQTDVITHHTHKVREYISEKLKSSPLSEGNLPLVKGLILGQKQEISPETLTKFSDAGAIHILAISGLHVGILLFFFKQITFPLRRLKGGLVLQLILLIVLLWSFALLAGFSPSVVRAVTMFSFVGIAIHKKRHTNIYNTLAASLLMLLTFHPGYIFDIGFQLSYIAVFSIVTLYPLLAKKWTPKNQITRYFYDIILVSFSAQIGVLPLSLYYFHQIPGLFFITNLFVIPILTGVLILGILSILFMEISVFFSLIAYVLDILITLMNYFISYIASFKQFVIRDIFLESTTLLMLYATFTALLIYLAKISWRRLITLLLTVILTMSCVIFNIFHSKKTNEWIVFHQVKNTTCLFSYKSKPRIVTTDSHIQESIEIKTYCKKKSLDINTPERMQNTYLFNGKRILIIDSSGVYPENVRPDFLLITQSPKIHPQRVIKSLKPGQVIIDGSNFPDYAVLWKHHCKKLNIPFHATHEKGYFSYSYIPD